MWSSARSSDKRLGDAVAILGLGRFGQALALELMAHGVEVLAVDASTENVAAMADQVTHSAQADTTNPTALNALSIADFGRVVVGIGSHIEASLLTASAVMDCGVPEVWAKADSEAHARILSQIGVHHVIRPESDTGRRVAHLLGGGTKDFIEISATAALIKVEVAKKYVGWTVRALEADPSFGLQVLAIGSEDGSFHRALSGHELAAGEVLLLTGSRRQIAAYERKRVH